MKVAEMIKLLGQLPCDSDVVIGVADNDDGTSFQYFDIQADSDTEQYAGSFYPLFPAIDYTKRPLASSAQWTADGIATVRKAAGLDF